MASIIERVSSLQEKGFKLVDSSQVNTEKSMPFGFPDVVMVADGSVKDAGIDYGVAFLYKENERNDAVHFALPDSLTQEQLSTLGQSGAMLLQTDSGEHSGYIFPNSPFLPDAIDRLQHTLDTNNIKTVPIPMDPISYGMFPYFNTSERHPSNMSIDDTVKLISHHLNGKIDAMGMSHEQRNVAFDIKEEPILESESPRMSPSMAPRPRGQ